MGVRLRNYVYEKLLSQLQKKKNRKITRKA